VNPQGPEEKELICDDCLCINCVQNHPWPKWNKPDPINIGSDYEGWCVPCIPPPPEPPTPPPEPPKVKVKESWTQYINDNNILFRSSLTEKVRRKLNIGKSCFDVIN
jgi:hypothetical protein